MQGVSIRLVLTVGSACLLGTHGNFLGKQLQGPTQLQDILVTLEQELGSGHGRTEEARVAELQEELRHTFAALPKNPQGNLQSAGARYALHRLFVQRHAWQLTGLDPKGNGWDGNTAADALGNTVPEGVRALFRERLGDQGVRLHELAVLAALLESMVHVEVDDRLLVTLEAFNHSAESVLDDANAARVLHAYMASFVLGAHLGDLTPQLVQKHYAVVEQVYPTWPDTQDFVDGVRNSVAGGATSFGFALLSEVLFAVGERYGRWQSKECSALKTTLVGMESRNGSGRVLLSDFYGSALNGQHWQFSESVDYLRQLGALDESNAQAMSVIIPNYIGSASNCVASTGYYSVCCVDECEELMDRAEHALGTSQAPPGAIVSALGGNFSSALLKRLDEVAQHHGGDVPLHGRLFAQWLHHAHPRECPFPHVTGTTNPQMVDAFVAAGNLQVSASTEEMQQFVSARGAVEEEPEEGLCANMWSMEEELVDATAHKSHRAARAPRPHAGLRSVMMCLAAASALVAVGRTALAAIGTSDGTEKAAGSASKGATYSV